MEGEDPTFQGGSGIQSATRMAGQILRIYEMGDFKVGRFRNKRVILIVTNSSIRNDTA
jgi:hypothetical protein